MASAASSSAVRCCASAALRISASSGSGSEMLLTAVPISSFYAEITALGGQWLCPSLCECRWQYLAAARRLIKAQLPRAKICGQP